MRVLAGICIFFLVGVSWAAEIKVNTAAPGVLPGVTAVMRSAGFWIGRHPSVDEPVLTSGAIDQLNRRWVEQGLVTDLAAVPAVLPGVKVRGMIAAINDGLKKKTLYAADGSSADPSFVAGFDREVDAVPDQVNVLYGFIVKPADQRLLPTDRALTLEAGDIDFDEIQNSVLDAGTPVLVLAHSRDRRWLFVQNAISSGWVLSSNIARSPADVFRRRASVARAVVVTSSRADVFLDKALSEYSLSARMGAVFMYKGLTTDHWEIEAPVADANGEVKFVPAFIPKKDASAGALPYTPRTIYEQAFKLLDAPYGWGDMNGGQDCSRFIQMIFASVGLQLPRNSAQQALAGDALDGFKEGLGAADRAALLVTKALPGVTVLALKGHIVLYLGSCNDKPYVLHSVWAYREPMPDGSQRARVIGRAAVTSLDLGAGSAKGSLLERLIAARIIR
jgi:hypothetical protein